MVEMIVRHKDRIDCVDRQTVLGQAFLDGTGSNADVDEECHPVVAEIVAIAVASTRKAQEPDHPI
jgi:hypothetical protein